MQVLLTIEFVNGKYQFPNSNKFLFRRCKCIQKRDKKISDKQRLYFGTRVNVNSGLIVLHL